MATLLQEDFSGGIYRGRKAPPASGYDLLNALLNDEGLPFLRGKTTYYSASNTTGTPTRLHALYMRAVAANRVLAAVPSGNLYALDGTLAPVDVGDSGATWSRPASIGDFAVFASAGNTNFTFYGGSLKASNYGIGTVSISNGSTAVTGAGTSWTANADAGMIFGPNAGGLAVVKKVVSNTSIELASPWGFANIAGGNYTLFPTYPLGTSQVAGGADATATTRSFVAAVTGTLLYAVGDRVYYATLPDLVNGWNINAYHEIPDGAVIVGLESLGTSAVVFTTRGIWIIENLYLDAIDDFGNIQRPVEQVNKHVVLWDDFGVAAWDSSIVVPAIDDVYLVSADYGVRVLSEGIRPLYRSYVKAGYQPGFAAIHRGHYFLPILNGTTQIDTLVCRLDRPYRTRGGVFYPWTRWAGHASGPAFASLISEPTRSPKLLGLGGQRVTDLSACMDLTGGAATQDADATTPTFTVDSNDFDTGPGIRPNTVEKVRYVYETAGGTPTFTVASAVGAEGASFTAATLKRGGGASDGTDYSAWRVGRKAERVRFRFQTSSAVTSLILRRLELTIRQAGQT